MLAHHVDGVALVYIVEKGTYTPLHFSLWEVKKEVKNKLSYIEEYKPSKCVQECGFKTFTHIPLAGI